jgi:hypothetical protein
MASFFAGRAPAAGRRASAGRRVAGVGAMLVLSAAIQAAYGSNQAVTGTAWFEP